MSRLTRAARSLVKRWRRPTAADTPGRTAKTSARKRYLAAAAARRSDDTSTIISFEPRILESFDLINSHSPRNMEDAIHRAADILRWLEQRQPAAIHELGSGRSTVVYAVWAARNGARHAAFEQDPVWCELTERAIELAGGNGHVILTPVEKTATAIRYLRAIPEDADFVYVDGPSGGGKHYATPDRTPVGLSIVDHVRSGNRPATIMIDGRASTCRALLSVLAARDYVISPQYHVAAEFGGSDDELNRHTVLTLRR